MMHGEAGEIVHDAAVARIERHEYLYEQEQGKELYAQEKKVYGQLKEILKKLPEEDREISGSTVMPEQPMKQRGTTICIRQDLRTGYVP